MALRLRFYTNAEVDFYGLLKYLGYVYECKSQLEVDLFIIVLQKRVAHSFCLIHIQAKVAKQFFQVKRGADSLNASAPPGFDTGHLQDRLSGFPVLSRVVCLETSTITLMFKCTKK